MVLTSWYFPFLDIQTTELLRYIFWWSSQTKGPKIGRERHEVYWKKTAANIFFRAISLIFFSFLRTTIPIETPDNFPEPRPKLCWNSNFRIFSLQHLSSCSWRHTENCWYFNQNSIQQQFFRYKTTVLSVFGYTNKRTAQIYPLVIFSNKRPNNREGTPQDFNEKKNSRKHFLLGQFLSVFSSFLGTISPIKTSENFPEPREGFAEVQIFVLFSPLSGFLNFLTTNSPIGTFERFTEQDFFWNSSFVIFSLQHWQFALDGTKSNGDFSTKSWPAGFFWF